MSERVRACVRVRIGARMRLCVRGHNGAIVRACVRLQNGRSPLMVAAFFNNTNVVRMLLSHGADPNLQNVVRVLIVLVPVLVLVGIV